jgi:hypothetical protein
MFSQVLTTAVQQVPAPPLPQEDTLQDL